MFIVQKLLLLSCFYALTAYGKTIPPEGRTYQCPEKICFEELYRTPECSYILVQSNCLCFSPFHCAREARYNTLCNNITCQAIPTTTTTIAPEVSGSTITLSIVTAILSMIIVLGTVLAIYNNRQRLMRAFVSFRDREERDRKER